MDWHDGLDIVTGAATVLASVLALLAIRNGNRQAHTSLQAIAVERRLAFQLDALRRIREVIPESSPRARDAVGAALSLVPDLSLPYCRAFYSIGGDPALGQAIWDPITARAGQADLNRFDAQVEGTGQTAIALMEQEVDGLISEALVQIPVLPRRSRWRRFRRR